MPRLLLRLLLALGSLLEHASLSCCLQVGSVSGQLMPHVGSTCNMAERLGWLSIGICDEGTCLIHMDTCRLTPMPWQLS